MFRFCLTSVLACAALPAHAEDAPVAPVAWEIQVFRDGRVVDTFKQTTSIGQARTNTHTIPSSRPACVSAASGASGASAANTVSETSTASAAAADSTSGASAAVTPQDALSRTVTIAPLYTDGATIGLAIDAQETFDDDQANAGSACAAPRQIVASNPNLTVQAGDWVDWTLIDHDPMLVYRVRATLAKD